MRYVNIVLIIVLLLVAACGPVPVDTFSGEKANLVFYVMSQCPYGTQVEEAIVPVLAEMGEAVNYKVEFIVSENEDGSFNSLHGEPEVKGNIVQLCVQENYNDKFVKFLSCMNKNPSNIPDNWKDCAKENEINEAELEKCYTGDEGKKLLSESAKKAEKVNAQGSPTIYINDNLYQGQRSPKDFKKGLCQYIEGHESCENIPVCSADKDCPQKKDQISKCENPDSKESKCSYTDAKPFDIVVLSSSKCKNCDATQIVNTLAQIPGANAKILNIEDDEGKQLIEELNIKKLPVVLFSKSVKETQFWKLQPNLPKLLEDKGDWLKFPDEATGANFFISEEERNKLLKDADMLKDKPVLDFFVMSYCPFGNVAEEAVGPVYDLLKDKVYFRPRYVIYGNFKDGGSDYCLDDGKLCSLHGVQELNQNIREACVKEKHGLQSWFDFAFKMNTACDYNNADTCWEPVAKELDLDTEFIKECQKSKGVDIMREDKRVGDLFSVSGSPTMFINGEQFSGGRNSEAIKQAICDTFDQKPAECDTVLEGDVAQAPAGNC